jgi:curved DNA-binding protein CbpA
MPTAARPDLLAFMDAYKVLGVDYSADSAAIRQAHKRLAKQHHPDRFPVGSAEQQQATAHMAAINHAYGLIRKAPLRYHRVSKASDHTTPWTDTELDDDIRRARTNLKVDRRMMDVEDVDRWMTVALVVLAVAVPVFTSSVAVFKTRAPLAVHVPQAALRQPGPLTGLSTEASSKKISAQELESQLIQSSGYFADAKLRCDPTRAGWDYICSYTPTDQPLFPRLHFGVNVDSKRVRQISRTVPFGVPIPPLGL